MCGALVGITDSRVLRFLPPERGEYGYRRESDGKRGDAVRKRRADKILIDGN